MKSVLILALAACAWAQTPSPPCLLREPDQRAYTRERLLTMVEGQGPEGRDWAVNLIRTCGVAVPFTPQLESDLRKIGADEKVINAVREVAPPKPEPPKAPKAGDLKTNHGLSYAYIPPGHFKMGCSDGDTCDADEKPAHEVEITKGFWLGRTEVTSEAFEQYRQATGTAKLPEKDSFGRALNTAGNPKAPAVAMTWDEASGYCKWAGARLPTEAEWEYAARAGNTHARYGRLEDVAWYGDNSGKTKIDSTEMWNKDSASYAKKLYENGNGPKTVGLLAPNSWGLYDTLGNVWEWTADWYNDKYYQGSERSDPKGPPNGTQRSLRGGSWYDNPSFVRASFRGRIEPGYRLSGVGFRCLWE